MKGAAIWERLSPQQKNILEIVYQVDTEIKIREEQQLGKAIYHKQVARWLFYGNDNTNRFSRLKLLSIRAGLTDTKVDDLFHALADYKLIERLGEWPNFGICLTPLGYQAVQMEQAELQPGEHGQKKCLDESAWQGLVLICQQWKGSLPADVPGKRYANILLKSWHVLARQSPPLVKIRREWVQATAFAHLFYAQQYLQYRNYYPCIKAPTPQFSKDDIIHQLMQAKDWATLARVKRGKRGLARAIAEIGGDVDARALYQFEKGHQLTNRKQKRIIQWIVSEEQPSPK